MRGKGARLSYREETPRSREWLVAFPAVQMKSFAGGMKRLQTPQNTDWKSLQVTLDQAEAPRELHSSHSLWHGMGAGDWPGQG